jgi:ribosomal protein S8
MLIKRKYSGELQHLISSIKKAADRSQETVIFKKSGRYHAAVLDVLVQAGFIKTYKELPELLVIRLKSHGFTHQVPSFVELAKVSRVGRQANINIQQLTKLQRREGGAAYYIMSTDQGIMTSFEAIARHISGKVLFRIA